jgi:hypothetical protein
MEDNLLYIPQMLLIGSTGRNSGKTTLGTAFIKRWKPEYPIIGLKVTTIHERNGQCPRGGDGCGVCSSIKGEYEVLEEKNQNSNKDTSLLLAAGAERVYWIKSQNTHISMAINQFMKSIPKDALILCESNSLRNVIKPGSFIMLNNTANSSIKKTAAEVMKDADAIINVDLRTDINRILQSIEVEKSTYGPRINIISA